MSDNQTLLREAVNSALQRFIGTPVSPTSTENVKNAVMSVMRSMTEVLEIDAKLPRVEVTANGDSMSIALFDAETNEPISVADWASRSVR